MSGEISILNVGAGDTKLTFDPSDPTEVAHSARIVKDMIRRGFVLLIEVGRDEKGPIYRRAHDFNEATAEYIVAGMSADEEIIEPEEPTHDQEPSIPPQRARKATPARAAGRKRIAASGAKAIAVSRTAGG